MFVFCVVSHLKKVFTLPGPCSMKYNILGLSVPINFEDGLMVTQSACGYYDPKTDAVYCDKSLNGYDRSHTLIHELVHGIMFRVGVHCTSISNDTKEIICENVATVILENKAIMKKLLDQAK